MSPILPGALPVSRRPYNNDGAGFRRDGFSGVPIPFAVALNLHLSFWLPATALHVQFFAEGDFFRAYFCGRLCNAPGFRGASPLKTALFSRRPCKKNQQKPDRCFCRQNTSEAL
jgi:hypothetical protein